MSVPENSGSESQPPPKQGLFDIQAKAPAASSRSFDFQAKAPVLPPAAERQRIERPATAPRDAAQFALIAARWDLVLAGFALILVVLLALFPAGNSDLWMHLATGRLLANGEYSPGQDTFSITTSGTTWINHAWLYDWLLYALYTLFGGPSLVILKAIVAITLAVVLFRAAAPTRSNWFSAIVCCVLAMLVLSPRLLLQPTIFSMLGLGITLCVLENSEQSPRRLWILPPLFALWVNLDGWFILGPLMVLLYLVGLAIQRAVGATGMAGRAKNLVLTLLAGVAACLLNPHHIQAFTLPQELAYLAVQLGDFWPANLVAAGKTMNELAVGDNQLTASPFGSYHFFQPGLGHNAAGKAYFVLLFLCIGSFALLAYLRRQEGVRAFPWTRALVCLVFGLLSVIFARLIPFFAVVAGPIMALNIRDGAAMESAATRLRQNLWLGARAGTVLALGLLLFFAWPGWLHSSFGDLSASHRVGVTVDPDVSLAAAAGFLKQGPGDGKVFNTSPDFANYLAWHGGAAKGFMDYRFGLFAATAKDYLEARSSLRQEAEKTLKQEETSKDPAWRSIFRKYGITQVSLHNYQRESYPRIVATWMLLQPNEWTLLYGDGRTIVFGLEEPGKPRRYPDPRETLSREAFTESQPSDLASVNPPAVPQARDFWIDYAVGRPKPSLASSKAAFHFDHYRIIQQQWQPAYIQGSRTASWNAVPAMAVSAPGTVTGPATLTAFVWLPNRVLGLPYGNDQRPFLRGRDGGMPALPILMLREALRAVRENPADPQAFRLLADAYSLVWRNQEDYWGNYTALGGTALRQELRRMQVLGALQRAVELDPRDPDLQMALAQKYDQLYLLDAAHEHVQIACQNLHLLARQPGEKDKELHDRKQSMLQMRDNFKKELNVRKQDFDLRTSRRNLLEKYRFAVEYPYKALEKNKELVDKQGRGLALVGLAALQELIADSAKLNQLEPAERADVAHSLARLLILLGRWQDARGVLGNLEGSPMYLTFQAMLGAATGDYEALDKNLADIDKGIPIEPVRHMFAVRVATLPALLAVNDAPQARICLFLLSRSQSLGAQQDYYQMLMAAAPVRTLRGIFALDMGETTKARQHFQAALQLAGPQLFFMDRQIAQRYVELMGK